MARNRTPTNILELKGAFKKDPQRKRTQEPVPEGEFKKTAPRHLLPQHKAAWDEVVGLTPPGVLTSSDPLIVEKVSVCLHEFREMAAGRKPWNTNLLTRLSTDMDKLGLSPSGRAKLSVEKPKQNKFKDD